MRAHDDEMTNRHELLRLVALALGSLVIAELATELVSIRGSIATLASSALAVVLTAFGAARLVLGPMHRAHRQAVRARDEGLGRLEAALARRTFDVRLARALEATTNERQVIDVVANAMQEISPAHSSELLLIGSDGGDALRRAAASAVCSPANGCPVPTLAGCRAVQHGRTEVFDASDTIDACAHLRHRPDGDRAAVCVPVTVAGRNVGVLHTHTEPDEALDAATIVRLEELAAQSAARISLLRAVQHATEQAVTDPLTGAANRRSLDARVRALVADGVPFTIAIADLDHFKRVNDEFGHETGDRVLRTFAEAMRRTLRPDDLIVRFGGDEFVMVIAGCDTRQAGNVLERVRRELARGTELAELPGTTASFGVADCSVGRSLSAVLGVADSALLEAKRAGRDRVVMSTGEIDITLTPPQHHVRR